MFLQNFLRFNDSFKKYNIKQNYFFNKPLVTTFVGLSYFSVPGKL